MILLFDGLFHTHEGGFIIPPVCAEFIQQPLAVGGDQQIAVGKERAALANAVQYVVVSFHHINSALPQGCDKGRCRRVNDGGVDVENGAHIPFAKIDRLVEDDQYFYIFQSRQMAVMIPKGSLLPANPERFAKVLAKETGKDWQQPKSLWGLNLKDLIQMVKDRFHRGES